MRLCYEFGHPNKMLEGPVHVAFFGSGDFANIIKLRSLEWTLTRCDWCPCEEGDTGAHAGRISCDSRADIGGVQRPQAKGHGLEAKN